MKTYIFWNEKQSYIFKEKNNDEAYHYILNHYDVSGDCYYREIINLETELNQFTVKADLSSLKLKKFHRFISSGDNTFTYELNMSLNKPKQ